jgi:hypothetical protein
VKEDVMDEKIAYAVKHDADSNCQPDVKTRQYACQDEKKRHDCKEQPENVISLEAFSCVVVVILMEKPSKPMHDVFVKKPSYSFH